MPQPLAVTAFMASPGRFELPAPRLGGVCSIQLSYGDIFDFSWSRMERSASQDFDDLPLRRRSLYPSELLGQMKQYQKIGIRLISCLGGGRSIQLSYRRGYRLHCTASGRLCQRQERAKKVKNSAKYLAIGKTTAYTI